MELKSEHLKDLINKCEYYKKNNVAMNQRRYEYVDFSSFLYAFATENISGYLNEFDLADRSLLTVGSSGDQVISAISKGCKDITHFDINPYSKYYIYLKLAGILSLNFAEFYVFFDYFLNYSPSKFEKSLYKKIINTLKSLDSDSYDIWKTLFETYTPHTIKKSLFVSDNTTLGVPLYRLIPYLSHPDIHEKTKANIKTANIQFLVGNIADAQLDRQFDNIWLSNITQYLSRNKSISVINKIIEYLTKNGQILMEYMYFYDENAQSEFHTYNPSIIPFESCSQYCNQDAAVIYKKIK